MRPHPRRVLRSGFGGFRLEVTSVQRRYEQLRDRLLALADQARPRGQLTRSPVKHPPVHQGPADMIAVLLDALDRLAISDTERASLTCWPIEAHTAENITAVIIAPVGSGRVASSLDLPPRRGSAPGVAPWGIGRESARREFRGRCGEDDSYSVVEEPFSSSSPVHSGAVAAWGWHQVTGVVPLAARR